jgi:LysR family transcriptional regulator, glycine cleavage system transcriptional activator
MAVRLPPLSALRAFEAVVRHGSVTRAAAELGVTQPAISQRLRQLEAFLERPLVRRDAGGIAITADGQAYGARLERAFAEIRAATEAVRVGERGLTVSVLATFAQRWLIPRLAGFQEAHPEIEVRLLATSRIADLWREDVDLSIRPGDGSWRGARSDFLVANDLFPVASPALLERQPVREPADLAAQVLIRVEAEPRDQDWPRWLAAAGVRELRPRGWLPLASSSHAIEAAIAGLGVAIGHTPFVVDALDAGRLVAPLACRIAEDGYFLVAARDKAESRKVRRFRSWLVAGQ